MQAPLLFRTVVIAGVALAILVPISLVSNKISERQNRADAVVAKFASETSGPQLVLGPLLAVTCEETFSEERQVMRSGKAETVSEKKTNPCPTAYFAPRLFKANASMPVETLHRGIYSIRLYRADLELTGEFDWPEPPISTATISRAWKQVYIGSFVKDPRGIKAITSSISSELLAGAGESAIEQFSIREHVGPYVSRKAGAVTPFAYKFALVGDRKSTRLNSSHLSVSRMPSSA